VPKFSPLRCIKISWSTQIDSLIANGLEVISCGANVPLLIKKSFGPIMEDVDHSKLIPDFISNCGMACICLLHGEKVQMTDEAIFHDTSEIIKKQFLKHML
jgi:hypothetical protein